MNNKILLLGGGGHCKSVLDSLLNTNQYSDIHIIDLKANVGKTILGVKIIGCEDDLPTLYNEGYHYAFITLGSVGDPSRRIKLYKLIEQYGFVIPNIIDSSAMISNYTDFENGIYVGKNVVINAGVSIKNGAIINTSATIEHDCCINEFSHIAPGTVLCGEVTVGANTHIGANSVVRQQVEIGSDTIIGMGSVVLKSIRSSVIAYGNPCKEVRSI